MWLTTLVVFTSERVRDAEQGLSAVEFMRGLGLAAAVVAIVALVLIEFVYRNRFRRATYHWLLFLGLLVLPGIVLMSMTTMVSEETKKVDACATCHAMAPFIKDIRDPFSATLAARHYKNKWVPDHQCYMCHTTVEHE